MRILLLVAFFSFACRQASNKVPSISNAANLKGSLLTHKVDLKKTILKFYYQDENGNNFHNHKTLKNHLKGRGKILTFAMNGGMYKKDSSPQGLYIENGKVIQEMSTQQEGYGNFYLQPNGIFYINDDNKAGIVATSSLKNINTLKYATQSGPMLVTNGKMHPAFKKGSNNLHIRNAVGLLPNGNLLFVMSKEKINFYDLASYFILNDCKNALYLDGFVSRTYLPSNNWIQEDGNFGVIIGEIKG